MGQKLNIDNLDLRTEEQKAEHEKKNSSRRVDVDTTIKSYNTQEASYKPFVHLHLHTFHSILDGCGSIDNYVQLAQKYNHPAMAITDHGTLSGLFEFQKKCNRGGIKPILGVEAYVNDNMGEMEEKKYEGGNAHQILLIMNKTGFVNANHLAYRSFTEGFYRRGRMKTDWILEKSEGLFATTSCMAHKVSRLFFNQSPEAAEQYFIKLLDTFKSNFAVEIHLNELKDQYYINAFLIEMANKYGVPVIIGTDVHYAYPEDVELQDTLIAVNQKRDLANSFKLDTRYLYYHNSQDLYMFNKRFGYNYPESFLDSCFKNSLWVAEKCNFQMETGVHKYPKFEPPKEVLDYFKTDNVRDITTKLAFGKLKQKLNKYKETKAVEVNDEVEMEYAKRLQYEIDVIDSKGMLDYFLVNWEIIRDYRSKGYEIGPARGSAAGSLLSWCLDITKIDPIRFGLYFERFLNPTRNSPPDIDIDFMSDTDHITTEFLYEKYGRERVLSVSTFQTFNEKNCLKDVTRAHGQDTGYDSDVHAVTQEMPDFSKVDYNLAHWFESYPKEKECSPNVKEWLTNPNNKKILEQTLKLQGQIRGIGQHAAGIVVTPSASWEHIPTNIIASNKSIVTAFQEADKSGKDLSELGILKLDRLKLDTLNVIQDSIKLIKKTKGVDVTDKIYYIDLNDKNLYLELRLGQNKGVFQFESSGMNALIRGMQVENFDEMVAANALYRPGPMGIKAHEEYIQNKFDSKNIQYIDESLRPILGPTNGVMIFQEQVMFIANQIGGMTLGDGDMLRRAMDKASKLIDKENKGELQDDERQSDKFQFFVEYWTQFLDGAKKKGLLPETIDNIKNWMIKYLGYSFNKSHCVSYSYIAAQTLFLKHYYPTEFYTSLLNHPKSSSKKEEERQWLAAAIAAAMSKNISIKAPSRKSGWNWTMTGDREISMGFSGINGLGDVAFQELQTILEARKIDFDKMTIAQFFDLPFSKFNKTAFKACLKAGVFDDWSESRDHLLSLWEKRKKKKESVGQMALFDMDSPELSASLVSSVKFSPTEEEQKRIEFVEVCNFDLIKIKEMVKIKEQIQERAGREIESIMNFEEDDYYFFVVDSFFERLTEKGKKYIEIKMGDGISHRTMRAFSPFCDKILPKLEKGGVYVSQFVKNKKGFVNFGRQAQFGRIK